MMSAAHRDALAIENGGKIVGVNADRFEGNDGTLVLCLAEDADAVQRPKFLLRKPRKGDFVSGCRFAT